MGEYADEYFRKEVEKEFGFDPGSMYPKEASKKYKVKCSKCGKLLNKHGLQNHMKDKHEENKGQL